MRYEQRRHTSLVHADADAVARHAWLRYFKFSATDAVSITDADFVVSESIDGEVLPELAESKITSAQELFPVMIRIDLVDKNGALLPAMTGEVGLRIAIDIEFAHHSPSRNRRLPD
jgi:hypothetical protein